MSIVKKNPPLALALAYLVPLLFWSVFVLSYLPKTQGFWSLGLGWLLMSGSTLALYLGNRNEAPNADEDLPVETQELPQDILAPYLNKIEGLTQELNNARGQGLRYLQDKDETITELHGEVARLKQELAEQQELTYDLFNKIDQLHQGASQLVQPPKERVSYDAESMLRRSLELAEQLTGASSFNPEVGGGSQPVDSYALDQRRLYQALGKESRGVIFLFSPKEEKLLYVSQSTKPLLGQSPDLFAQDFSKKLREDEEWKSRMATLAEKERVHLSLSLEQRGGDELYCDCQAARIAKGLFKNKIIGVLTVQ